MSGDDGSGENEGFGVIELFPKEIQFVLLLVEYSGSLQVESVSQEDTTVRKSAYNETLILQLANQFVDVRHGRVSLSSHLSSSNSSFSSGDSAFEQGDLIGVLLEHRDLRDLLNVRN